MPGRTSPQVDKLAPMHIQNFYTHCRTNGRLDGKGGLSERTVLHMHTVLHVALKCAVRWQALARNPVDAVAARGCRTPHQ